MKKIQIDPYKACKLFYGDSVNDVNNCLSETTAAFLGTDSINSFSDTKIYKSNQEHVFDLVRKRSGGFPPDVMRPINAPVFNQIPNYFPALLEKNSGDIKKSIYECKNMCDNNSMYKNECKNRCDIQSLSVENFDKDVRKKSKKCKKVSYKDIKKPWGFYISFIIVSLMFAIVIVFFLNGIFLEKF